MHKGSPVPLPFRTGDVEFLEDGSIRIHGDYDVEGLGTKSLRFVPRKPPGDPPPEKK